MKDFVFTRGVKFIIYWRCHEIGKRIIKTQKINVTPHEVQDLLSATVSTLRDLAVLVDLRRSRTSDLLENSNTSVHFTSVESGKPV